MKGSEIAHAARNFKDKGVARHSLAPTGWGDGGGGTTREMVGKAARLRDLEGSATVRWQRPAEFFAEAEAEYPKPPVWVGELYLELHRATLTSQARTKQGNRRSENLLREAELWCTTAALRTGLAYPYEQLDRIWKTVLLHQFHDILPGSSIAWVHREAEATYAGLAAELEELVGAAQRALAGDPAGGRELVFNGAPHGRSAVPAGGAAVAVAGPGDCSVAAREGGGFVLDNGLLRVVVDGDGLVVSAVDAASGREAVAPGGRANLLQLHPDFPNMWDAWDVDEFYRNTVTDLVGAEEVAVHAEGPAEVAVRVVRSFGSSTMTQTLTLRAGTGRLDIDTEVDWHEAEKFLKLAFPLDVHTERYAAETQFGHQFRPTHTNTSWDAAKFEACNHRFVHLAEPGWGVALVTPSTYGHDVTRAVRADDGGTTTTVRFSLLRAPRFPDPRTDQGRHRFRHALVPGAEIGDAVREGYAVGLPERRVTGSAESVRPLVELDQDALVVSAVKLADDGSGDLVVRVYESGGGRARGRLATSFALAAAVPCDLLERPWDGTRGEVVADGDGVRLALRPFELVTLRLTPAR